jgi:hypothetical protein
MLLKLLNIKMIGKVAAPVLETNINGSRDPLR